MVTSERGLIAHLVSTATVTLIALDNVILSRVMDSTSFAVSPAFITKALVCATSNDETEMP